ncbi:aldo/keto reductase [Treponema zioleckii]|uniref:aldo/keto reductase n=1 Tax=Treponema zioleckii TaxID=331680 RepID=UPI001F5BD393|nr:aldo/keto reductase [Treponema zioleckii]
MIVSISCFSPKTRTIIPSLFSSPNPIVLNLILAPIQIRISISFYRNLKCGFFLLYIHQPAGNWLVGYRHLEKALNEGKARSIGISNFEGIYIEELETKWKTPPQFIQVEAHPYFTQKDLRFFCKFSTKLKIQAI